MNEPQERHIDSDGVDIRVVVEGDAAAPALVLVNGALCRLESWTNAMPTLRDAFRVVRFDLRGNGESGPGPKGTYNFPQYADDITAVLDTLDIEQAFVCGLAYGARTAARFALRHPTRTALLGLFDVSLDQPVDQALQKAGNEEAKRLRAVAGIPEVEVPHEWFEHQDRRSALRSLMAHDGQPDPTPELARVHVPTLVACGRQDVNLPEAERIAALVPDAELQIMEMTGHGSVLTRPELVADLIVDFAARRMPAIES